MPLNFSIRSGLALLAASGLAACSFAPEYVRPDAPIAAQWPVPTEAEASSHTQADIAAWQDFIVDGQLRQLVALALQNNRDLRLALANIEQARAQYQIRSADQFPTINAGVTGNRQPKTDGSGDMSSAYSAGLLLTAWELDVFGRIANLKTAAQAQWLATQEARNAVQTSLVAAVASTWLSWQNNSQLLALTQATLASREESLRLVRLRFEQGVASALELRQAESVLAAARVTQAQQQRLQALDVNALTLLLGQPLPDTMQQHRPAVDALDALAASTLPLREVPVGLPSDLLQRRPDIRQAEQQLLATHANIGAARAAFFPRIALTASAGSASSALSGLFESGSWGWTLAPQALLPIFDAGRNQANLELAQAGRMAALAQYEKAIQTAFREVADALAGQSTLQQQWQAQQAQMQAEQERLRLADLRYRNGIANHLELLDAQRALFASQQAWVQTRLAQQQNQVALYKALGGGWKEGNGF
jgi:outer membrane protein, multidrug efflux system